MSTDGGRALTARAVTARHARLARVRARCAQMGVDGLLLSHGADLPWLTGYTAMPLERLTMLVVPAEGDLALVVPALEAPRVADAGALFECVAWADGEDPIEIVRQLVESRNRGLATPTLAVSDRTWAASLLSLQSAIPGGTWVPASVVTGPVRAVKDEHEIEALSLAGAAADRVAAALQAGEVPLRGRPEREVSAELGARLIAAGHHKVNFAIVGSGPNGASPHHEAGDRVIATGDLVVCDFGGALSVDGDVGYCSDITRTIAVGEPDDEARRCYAVLAEAHARAVEAARPGASAESVDATAREVIADAGLGERFFHRTGHGIGIEEHEDPYIVMGNHTELMAGHAFSVEPGIYLPGRFGMRLEDIVVVDQSGVQSMNRVNHELVVVDA